MKWEVIEDRICTLVFIKNHVLNRSTLEKSALEAVSFGVVKTINSIKMKFNNIAVLCDEYGLTILTPVSRLDHYSRQNHNQFLSVKAYKEKEIIEELNRLKNQK